MLMIQHRAFCIGQILLIIKQGSCVERFYSNFIPQFFLQYCLDYKCLTFRGNQANGYGLSRGQYNVAKHCLIELLCVT